jgi:hypothetical protein
VNGQAKEIVVVGGEIGFLRSNPFEAIMAQRPAFKINEIDC